MTSTNLFSSTAFVYVNSDVPEGATLREWRLARRARGDADHRPFWRRRFAI